jgi:membrane protein required for colicin V production
MLDLLLLVPLVYGGVRGLYNGFVKTIGSFVGLVVSILVAYLFADALSVIISQLFALTGEQSYVVSYIILLFVALLVCTLIVKALDGLVSFISLGWLNKLLGAIFGVLKYAIFLSLIIHLVEIVDVHYKKSPSQTRDQSVVYQSVRSVVPSIMPYIHFYNDAKNERTE